MVVEFWQKRKKGEKEKRRIGGWLLDIERNVIRVSYLTCVKTPTKSICTPTPPSFPSASHKSPVPGRKDPSRVMHHGKPKNVYCSRGGSLSRSNRVGLSCSNRVMIVSQWYCTTQVPRFIPSLRDIKPWQHWELGFGNPRAIWSLKGCATWGPSDSEKSQKFLSEKLSSCKY